MEKMTDLQDLLKHEIKDLYSAEEQIIEAMPRMIEKANDQQLKTALQRHLQITEGQLKRLEQVQQLMEQDPHAIQEKKNTGLFARLMRRPSQESETESGDEKCLGMEGLIKEGQKVLAEEMEPSVLDAAIIACAQKIEHYEICGYGTARAYARELNMGEVAELLEQTLDEEYEADDRLTDMAIGRVNEEAEMAGDARRSSRSSASSAAGRSSSRSTAPGSTTRSRAGAALAASGSRNGSSATKRSSSGTSRTATTSSSRGSSSSGRSTGRTKTASKTSSRGGSAAPAGKASAARSTTKSSGRTATKSSSRSTTGSSRTATKTSGRSTTKSSGRTTSSGSTHTATASRTSKAPSKAAAAKGGRNSSGGGRTASKSTGRGSSSGRSSGRR